MAKNREISLDTAIEIPDELTDLDQGELEAGLHITKLTNDANLSERDAELVARRYQGETLAEIARRLGMKESTARVAFHRAQKKMVKTM